MRTSTVTVLSAATPSREIETTCLCGGSSRLKPVGRGARGDELPRAVCADGVHAGAPSSVAAATSTAQRACICAGNSKDRTERRSGADQVFARRADSVADSVALQPPAR